MVQNRKWSKRCTKYATLICHDLLCVSKRLLGVLCDVFATFAVKGFRSFCLTPYDFSILMNSPVVALTATFNFASERLVP